MLFSIQVLLTIAFVNILTTGLLLLGIHLRKSHKATKNNDKCKARCPKHRHRG